LARSPIFPRMGQMKRPVMVTIEQSRRVRLLATAEYALCPDCGVETWMVPPSAFPAVSEVTLARVIEGIEQGVLHTGKIDGQLLVCLGSSSNL